ncbi:MAG: hypothetical protein ACKOW9_03015 [Candidatus Paceibacterota bacterium]
MDIHRYLAEQTEIPLDRMLSLFNHKSARIPLATRNDLPEQLTEKIINTSELITYWASTNDRPSNHLSKALQTLINEKTDLNGLRSLAYSALAKQSNLLPEDIETLANIPEQSLAHTLLHRNDLTTTITAKLINYLSSETDKELTIPQIRERLSSSKELALLLLNNQSLSNIILGLIAEYHSHSPEVATKLISYLTTYIPSHIENINIQNRVLSRVVSNPFLTEHELTLALSVPNISDELRDEIHKRIENNYALALTNLNCSPDEICNDKTHIEILNILKNARNTISLPTVQILKAILAHFEDLDSTYYALISTVKINDIRDYAKHLFETKKENHLVNLVKMQNTSVLLDIPNAEPVIIALAQEGNQNLIHSRYLMSYAHVVVENFSPIYKLTPDKYYLSLILEIIDKEEKNVAETAVSLLGEWNSSLTTLLHSARTLA